MNNQKRCEMLLDAHRKGANLPPCDLELISGKTSLKPYMGYSRSGGTTEGAILIFAHSVREAKRVAWDATTFLQDATDGNYTDLAVTLIRDGNHLFAEGNAEKLAADIPHVIECPTSCKGCHLWGEPLNEQGYCEGCEEGYEDYKAGLV